MDYNFRIICPHCSSLKVVDIEDKNIVLFYNANGSRVYAKRKRCKECNYVWRN